MSRFKLDAFSDETSSPSMIHPYTPPMTDSESVSLRSF